MNIKKYHIIDGQSMLTVRLIQFFSKIIHSYYVVFLFIYKTIIKNNNEIANVGIEIIDPYFIKLKNENLISCLFNKEENIIPAKAPIGVNIAPILLPIIEE